MSLSLKKLLDRQTVPLFDQARDFIHGEANYVVISYDPSSKQGQGVDAEQRFPWIANAISSDSWASLKLLGSSGMFSCISVSVRAAIDEYDDEDPRLWVSIKGDFLEIMRHVFNKVPEELQLHLTMEFSSDDGEEPDEMKLDSGKF